MPTESSHASSDAKASEIDEIKEIGKVETDNIIKSLDKTLELRLRRNFLIHRR